MEAKPSYEELEKRVKELEEGAIERIQAEMVIEKFFEQPMNIHLIAGFDGLIHRVNIGWKTIMGYSKNEVEGTIFFDLVHPEDQVPTIEEMEKLGKGETTFYFENRYRHKDGNYRFLAWSAIASLKDQLVYAVASDITERKQAEEALKEREVKLARKNMRLEELNSALKILLERRNQDKTELEENILTNMKQLVLPYVEKLKKAGLSDKQEIFADILQSNLEDIVSPFAHKLSHKYLNFSPTELKVANLVKQGLSTKEIADLFNSSPETVSGHRKSMRKKLELTDKKSNLRTHLLYLSDGDI